MAIYIIFLILFVFFLITTSSAVLADTATEQEMIDAGVSLRKENHTCVEEEDSEGGYTHQSHMLPADVLSDPTNIEVMFMVEKCDQF